MSRAEKRKEKKEKKNKILKIILRVILIIIIIIIVLVGSALAFINSKLSKMQHVEINEENLNIEESTQENLSEYRNIALFGVDSRNSDLGEGNRSDCIIIASINENTNEVRLISVYRDTYVDIEGHGLDKITHAYSYGGPELAIKTLNKNLDLNITEFVTVNFDAVADAVNALGGITINVEQNEISYLNSYLDETSKVTGLQTTRVTKAGKQTLDGVQAVAYSRIRYTSGGDYKRTERMRTVIEAMFEKVKTKSIGEINSLANTILPEIYTNINVGEILSLIPTALNFNITESIGWPYETKGITLDRWYGVPVTLETNVINLHKEAFGEEDYEPSSAVREINNSIIEKTGYNQ